MKMTTVKEDAGEAKRRKLEAKLTGGSAPGAPLRHNQQQQQQQQPKQKQKQAPQKASESDAASGEDASGGEEARGPFVCDANDVIAIRLVLTAGDMDTAELFEPEFTHQIFRDDETIFGYRDLEVRVFLQAHLFKAFVEVSYTEKVASVLNPADDVVAMLKKQLGDDVFTDRAAFLAALQADAAAPIPAGGGEVVAEWDSSSGGPSARGEAPGGAGTADVEVEAGTVAAGAAAGAEDGCKDTVRVFRLSDAEVWKWHARFEPLTLFYIDGASALDSEDERWLLFAVIRTHAVTGAWRLLSFATVYEFFVYPASTRGRLSQIVVLPPFQRRGLGGRILEAVRAHAVARQFHDITVEDPTPQLQRLRDAGDVRALAGRPGVMAAVQRCAVAASRLTGGDDAGASKAALDLPAAVAEEARAQLCICKPQMRRCWEALLYLMAKKAKAPDDSPAAAAFSELIIRRLTVLHCSDARRDAGSKRVYPTESGFVMMRGRGTGGQATEVEEDSEDKADPAEVLADYFHDAMSNLAWLATAVKI